MKEVISLQQFWKITTFLSGELKFRDGLLMLPYKNRYLQTLKYLF